MKKKCTPTNNAINICCPVECPEPIVPPTPEGCLDPWTYIFRIAKKSAEINNRSVAEEVDRILDKGLIMPNEDQVCCTTCDGPYAVASVETWLKLAEAVGWSNGEFSEPNINLCCNSVNASVETYLKYAEAVSGQDGPLPPCCETNYAECFAKLASLGAIERILDKGLIESNPPGSISWLCALYEQLVTLTEDELDGSTYAEIIDRLLDKGLVSHCYDDCNIIIASVETYLKFAEAVDLTQDAPVPLL